MFLSLSNVEQTGSNCLALEETASPVLVECKITRVSRSCYLHVSPFYLLVCNLDFHREHGSAITVTKNTVDNMTGRIEHGIRMSSCLDELCTDCMISCGKYGCYYAVLVL